MKITLTSEESIRLEPTPGPMTIESADPDQLYSPFHMLGSSLAFCTFSVLYEWSSNAGFGGEDLVIDVSWTFADNPHRVGAFDMRFRWPSLPASRAEAAKRAAALCAVHATFSHPPTLSVEQVQ